MYAIVETMNEDIVIPEPVTNESAEPVNNESAEEEIENEINHSRRFVKIIIWLILLYIIIALWFNAILNQGWLSKGCAGLPLSEC